MGIKCPKCQTDNLDTQKFCGECATPLPSSKEIPVTETLETPKKELTTGSTFAGRYQIIEELGKGGMGKVYKAHDTEIKEKVALKLLKPEIAADEKTIERFRNEIRLARKIVHKNVGRMYDLSKAEGTYFITMEYVEGQDLRGLIRQSRQLTLGTTINIAKQVSEGLAEAHKLGVVHRDLKPSNVMIDKEGSARIMDFGIARSIKAKGITGAGVIIGTPEYMSPEQVDAKETDQRSDIYSLGVILYEMVTGRVPFEGDTPLSVAVKQKTETPEDPRKLNSQIPEDLSNVILRCMEKDKEKRYQSSGEVRSVLANIEKGIPTTEKVIPKRRPITSKEISVTFSLKRLLIPGLIVAALVIAAMIIIWQVIPQKEAAPAKSGKYSIAVLPFEDLSPTKDHEYLCDGIAETLINSLNNIKDLWVPARASSFSFKGKDLGIREIGQELGVDNLLEASVQVIGNRLRITPKIINVNDGSQVWSEQYDRQMEDVFAIQDEIAQEIVNALKIKLLGEKEAYIVKSYTENLQAYNLYLKGRYFWNKRTEEGLRKSLDYFQQAIDLDPTYALAYVGLADAYNILGDWQYLEPKEAFPNAKAAARKALEIDDFLAEAHTALALSYFEYDWDWHSAEIEYKRAIALNPNYASAHHWYSEFLAVMGRHHEARVEIQKALELEPLSLIINAVSGELYQWARQDEDAIKQCKKTLEMDPDFIPAHYYLFGSYLRKGMVDESFNHFIVAYSAFHHLTREEKETVQTLYKESGWNGVARFMIAKLEIISKVKYFRPTDISIFYTMLKDYERALDYLEKAYQIRSPAMVLYVVQAAEFEALHSEPRFQALLKKVGLEK